MGLVFDNKETRHSGFGFVRFKTKVDVQCVPLVCWMIRWSLIKRLGFNMPGIVSSNMHVGIERRYDPSSVINFK